MTSSSAVATSDTVRDRLSEASATTPRFSGMPDSLRLLETSGLEGTALSASTAWNARTLKLAAGIGLPATES